MIKGTRIASGIYEVKYQSRTFRIERMSAIGDEASDNNNTWMLLEEKEFSTDYWNHFQYKWQAYDAIIRVMELEQS